jgi:DNA-binding NarL/FixJ family response regulator
VKRHLENILTKLQLKNRVTAAVYAVKERMISP